MLELLALIALLIVAVIWLAMRNGRQRAEVDTTKDTLATVLKAKEIENEVEALSPDALKSRSKLWVRNNTR
jgi:flagellar biogenesis protein FliO